MPSTRSRLYRNITLSGKKTDKIFPPKASVCVLQAGAFLSFLKLCHEAIALLFEILYNKIKSGFKVDSISPFKKLSTGARE